MCKEDFNAMKKVCEESEITISDKCCGSYGIIMTVYFYLNKDKKVNFSARKMLECFNENFGLRDYDITVKHNKKSLNTKKEEETALIEFLAELTK